MANLYNVPLKNGVQLTLQNTLTTGDTTTITFTTNVNTLLQASSSIKGILVIDRIDANGNETPTKTEYISFETVATNSVSTLVRGLATTTDQDHNAGAVVEFVPDVTWADAINDTFTDNHNADGTHKILAFQNLNAPEGFLINGKIVPSVASNNLTVALKTFAGNDPSASDPIYVRLGGTIRTISSALSVDAGAGTNWLLAGSSETAGIEVDFFVYLGVKTSDSSIKLGFSRIPYATIGSDFATTGSSARYCRMTGAEYPGDFGPFANIGRFAATLSASPHNWSVPTFDTSNLIQRPIYETRKLAYVPTWLANSTNPVLGNGTLLSNYTIVGKYVKFNIFFRPDTTTTFGSGFWSFSTPIGSAAATQVEAQFIGTGTAYGAGISYNFTGQANYLSGGGVNSIIFNTTNNVVQNTIPFTWQQSTGNYLFFGGQYSII